MSPTPIPLTLVVITKDVEKSLAKCLSSASWIPNKIVVDSGSQDKTVEIAKKFGATVIEQEWLGFGPQKFFAVSKAKTNWVLCLDADEFLSTELSTSIKSLFNNEQLCEGYVFARRNKFLGRFLSHGEGYPDWNLRLFNKNSAQWSDDLIHEKVVPHDNNFSIGKLKGDLMHESGESIGKYIEKQNKYTSIQAQAMIKQNKRVSIWKLFLSPLNRFCKYYFFKFGFMDGLAGFVHISIGSFFVFVKYLKVISLSKKEIN